MNEVQNYNDHPLGISVARAAYILGVSKPKVYEWIKRADNPLPAVKLDRRTLISYEDLREWFRGQAGNGGIKV